METKDYITLLLSSSALVVATLSYLNTWRQRRIDNQRTLRLALTDVIEKLVETDWQRSELDRSNEGTINDKVIESRRILNSKRSYLAWQGDYIAKQVPHLATDSDFSNLARAFAAINDYDRARSYWEQCIRKSTTPTIRSISLRGYARFLFIQGELDAGRRLYRESLEERVPDTDETRRIRADTYVMWMKAERDFGIPEEVQRLRAGALASARRIGASKSREEMAEYIESLSIPISSKETGRIPQAESRSLVD
jgi:tetratricopeptide (TPR) repeat protein